MTPAPPQVAPPPPESPVSGWQSYAQGLNPNLPDSALDALRDKYFQEHVAPQVLKAGYGLEPARQEFMKRTERPDKVTNPRTDLVMKSALAAAVAPLPQGPVDAERLSQQAQQEAVKQGVNPRPYSIAGDMLGQAPYWMAGLGAAGKLGEAVGAVKSAQRIMNVTTGAFIQGSYDAAKAPSGEKAVKGMEGAAAGGVMVGAFEGAGALLGSLFEKGVTPEEARAVQKVATGVASDEESQAAAKAVMRVPDLKEVIQKSVEDQVKATDAVGTPSESGSELLDKRIKIRVRRADGQVQNLGGAVGMKLEDFQKTVERLTDHLDNGGAVEAIKGDPRVVNQFYGMVEEMKAKSNGAFDLALPSREGGAPTKSENDVTVHFEKSHPINDIINARDSYYHATDVEGLMGILKDGQIEPSIDDYGKTGVSMSRAPTKVGGLGTELGESEIHLVLDRSKLPSSEPYQHQESDDEFEQVTLNKAVPISAIKGALIEKEAFKVRDPEDLKDIKSALKAANIPFRVISSKALEASRAVMSRLDPMFEMKQKYRISSSNLKSVGYDQDLQRLEVGFHSGHVYSYENVPQGIYEKLKSYGEDQASAGQYFHDEIRSNPDEYPFTKLKGPEVQKELGAAPEEEPEDTGTGQPPAILRGSSNLPITDQGESDIFHLGVRLQARGGLDEIHSADLTRHNQTADILETTNQLAQRFQGHVGFRSWALGALEGQPHDKVIGAVNDLVTKTPDIAMPGAGPISASLGESFNDFKYRMLTMSRILMNRLEENPDRKIGVVTSSRDIGLIKAWVAKGAGADQAVDTDLFTHSHENPGSVYRFAPDERTGRWEISQVNPDSDADLRGGIYFIRHGETPWNAASKGPEEGGGVSYKETPLSHRFSGDIPLLQESNARGGSVTPFPGEKPSLFYGEDADRQTLFHENLHGHIGYLGVRKDFHDALWEDGAVTKDLANHLNKTYGYMDNAGDAAEEAFVHTASAVRVGDQVKIKEFADADDGENHLLQWVTDTSKNLLDLAAQKEDSLHKRTLERRMNSVITRASGQIEDMRNAYRQSGIDISFTNNEYHLSGGGVDFTYPDRESALHFLETNHVQGLNVPELVDDSLLPDSVPRFDRGLPQPTNTVPPITTTPPAIDQLADPPRQGFNLVSRFFRPFYDWLDTTARKQGRPDLWDAFKPIDDRVIGMNNFIRPYGQVLKDTLAKYKSSRQSDFFTMMSTAPEDRAKIADEFKFTPQETKDLADFKEKFMDPLSADLGHDLNDYLRVTLPKIKSSGIDAAFPRYPMLKQEIGTIPHEKSPFQESIELGELSPSDTNLSRIAATYLRSGARKLWLNDTLNNAAKLLNETNEDGSYKLGLLRTPLVRHIEYLRGVPDYTQKVVYSVVQEALDKINVGIGAVNDKLPGGMQIPTIDAAPGDVLSKMILFNYAGQLALRPAILARDVAQYMLTTFPVLGNYSMVGLQKTFPMLRDLRSGGYEASDLYDIPLKYGALIEKNDLQALGPEGTMFAAAGKWTNKALSYIQLSHNSNRIAAFWGHEAMAKDALESFLQHGETDRLAKESGLWFANASTRSQYLKEAQMLDRTSDLDDISRRIAKEMVETTQWNFKRGANPGIYEYQLGRLFGQYGTWPMNYIEYARRFAQGSDKTEAMKALTRLVLTHGAVLAAGNAAGIDLASWTFTQPMAYGGGPALEVLTNIPQSLDFETRRGSEARSALAGAFWPGMIPGGHAMKEVFRGINSGDDSEMWKRLMGFQPLEERDKLRGLNSLVP